MNRVYLENFDNYHDATNWLDHYLHEKEDDEIILEASVRYVNNHWIAGVMFGKSQLGLFDDL